MTTYRFTCNYASGAGSWAAGDVAEFDDDFAAWLLRDVAGCIVVAGDETPEPEPEAPTRALDAPQHDRQLKRAPRKR